MGCLVREFQTGFTALTKKIYIIQHFINFYQYSIENRILTNSAK